MHLNVYLHSSSDLVRFRSICLLSETLTGLRNRGFDLSFAALGAIKPLLVSCLTMPEAKEPDTKILRRIVSCVARTVVKLEVRWDELGDCMLALVNTDPVRAFNIFLDLPLLDVGFINRFLKYLVEEIDDVLLNHEENIDEEYWTLALETAVKLGVQVSNFETGLDLARAILGTVLKSANLLVNKGKEEILQRGLAHLVKFLAQDSNMCSYSRNQCGFVSECAFRISGVGTHTQEAARKIYQMVTKLENHVSEPAFELSQSQGFFDLDLYNKLKTMSAVEILRIVASTRMDDMSREIAVGRLHHMLCDHTSKRVEIDVSEILQLKKLLMSCLNEVGVPENTFKILGQIVFHVALELLYYQEDKWFEVWDYIASECSTQFERTAYIFQCLTTMTLLDNENVIHAVDNLLPEIRIRLNPPGELLVDNSCWVLAFVGGFCAAVHSLDLYTESVGEIVEKMVDSVRELVGRGMEVGLVRRAFRDLESIVKKQVEWYDANEYRFTKSLLRKLYEIKGLRMESKLVLWRINKFLERGTPNVDKESRKQQDH